MGIFGIEIEKKEFGLLPSGKYLGYISKIEHKTSKAGNVYVQLEFTLENTRKVWDMMHWHSEICVRISAGKLESIGFSKEERDAITPENIIEKISEKKDGVIYEINVGIKKDEYGDKNIIKYFSKAEKNPF